MAEKNTAADLRGRRFGTLTVLRKCGIDRRGRRKPSAIWEVRCECGHKFTVTATSIRAERGLCYNCTPKSDRVNAAIMRAGER